MEPSRIPPHPGSLKPPAQPPNPSLGEPFPTDRSRDAEATRVLGGVPWRGVPTPKSSQELQQPWHHVPARCARCDQRCLPGSVQQGPCRGERDREEIPAWGREKPSRLDSRSRLHMSGSGGAGSSEGWGSLGCRGEAEQGDSPGCSSLHPFNTPGAAARAQPPPPRLLPFFGRVKCRLGSCNSHRFDRAWSRLRALGSGGVCQPSLLCPFCYQLAPCPSQEEAAASDVTPDPSPQGSRPN